LTGDKKGAIEDFTTAIKLKPAYTDLYYRRGELETDLELCEQAINDFSKVIDEDSTNSGAYYFKGMCLIKLKKKNEGCKDLVKAGELGYIYSYEQIQKYCK